MSPAAKAHRNCISLTKHSSFIIVTSTPETATASTDAAWYVIHVFTGQEEKIKSFLNEEVKRLHLEDQITQVLIPKEEVIEMRDGKKKTKTRVFFPGYMMVEMQLRSARERAVYSLVK